MPGSEFDAGEGGVIGGVGNCEGFGLSKGVLGLDVTSAGEGGGVGGLGLSKGVVGLDVTSAGEGGGVGGLV